jgi:hypothetical protein
MTETVFRKGDLVRPKATAGWSDGVVSSVDEGIVTVVTVWHELRDGKNSPGVSHWDPADLMHVLAPPSLSPRLRPDPVPPGDYEARIAGVTHGITKNGLPVFTVEFCIINAGGSDSGFAGRRVFRDYVYGHTRDDLGAVYDMANRQVQDLCNVAGIPCDQRGERLLTFDTDDLLNKSARITVVQRTMHGKVFCVVEYVSEPSPTPSESSVTRNLLRVIGHKDVTGVNVEGDPKRRQEAEMRIAPILRRHEAECRAANTLDASTFIRQYGRLLGSLEVGTRMTLTDDACSVATDGSFEHTPQRMVTFTVIDGGMGYRAVQFYTRYGIPMGDPLAGHEAAEKLYAFFTGTSIPESYSS